MKKKLLIIGIIVIFIIFMIIFLFKYIKLNSGYIMVNADYFKERDRRENINTIILAYEQKLIDDNIESGGTIDITAEMAVKIAKMFVFDYKSNELEKPYLVYLDEENDAYMVMAKYKKRSILSKVIIDKNTGGILLVQQINNY